MHSWLGLAVLGLLALQYAVSAFSYLWPKLALPHRQALGPLHRFLGKAVFAGGIATMAVRGELGDLWSVGGLVAGCRWGVG